MKEEDTVEGEMAKALRSVQRSLDSIVEENPKSESYVRLVRDFVERTLKAYDRGPLSQIAPLLRYGPKKCPRCGDLDIPTHLCRNADPLSFKIGVCEICGKSCEVKLYGMTFRCEKCANAVKPPPVMGACCKMCGNPPGGRGGCSFCSPLQSKGWDEKARPPGPPPVSMGVCTKCGDKGKPLVLAPDGSWRCIDCGTIHLTPNGGSSVGKCSECGKEKSLTLMVDGKWRCHDCVVALMTPLRGEPKEVMVRARENARLDMKLQCVAACRERLEASEKTLNVGPHVVSDAIKNCIRDIESIAP